MKPGKVPLGILSAMFFNNAHSFLISAEILIRESQKYIPTYFLLGHALELTLKAFLSAHGVPALELQRTFGHKLVEAYSKAAELKLKVDNEKVAPLVRVFSDFHEANVFRYPVTNKDGDLIVIGGLVHADEAFQIIKQIWESVRPDVIQARLRDAGKGTYSVEEWYMGGGPSDAD